MSCQASRPHSFLKTTVPEHEYLHPHMRRCRREQGGRCGRGPGIGAVGVRTCVGSAGGVAIADAASGVPGDSAGSAGPVRALEDPELSVRVTSIGGAVAEVAPPSTRAHRHAIPRSSPCSLMARGVYKRRRRGVMEREEGGLVCQMGIIQKAKMEGMYEGASTRRQRAIYAKFPPGPRRERWEGREESFGDDPDSRHRREGGQDADPPVVWQQSSRTHVGAVRPVQKHCAQSSSQSNLNPRKCKNLNKNGLGPGQTPVLK
jgi:hypothetical protein